MREAGEWEVPKTAGASLTIQESRSKIGHSDAGWSSQVARWAHNPKVAGSSPAPATKKTGRKAIGFFYLVKSQARLSFGTDKKA